MNKKIKILSLMVGVGFLGGKPYATAPSSVGENPPPRALPLRKRIDLVLNQEFPKDGHQKLRAEVAERLKDFYKIKEVDQRIEYLKKLNREYKKLPMDVGKNINLAQVVKERKNKINGTDLQRYVQKVWALTKTTNDSRATKTQSVNNAIKSNAEEKPGFFKRNKKALLYGLGSAAALGTTAYLYHQNPEQFQNYLRSLKDIAGQALGHVSDKASGVWKQVYAHYNNSPNIFNNIKGQLTHAQNATTTGAPGGLDQFRGICHTCSNKSLKDIAGQALGHVSDKASDLWKQVHAHYNNSPNIFNNIKGQLTHAQNATTTGAPGGLD